MTQQIAPVNLVAPGFLGVNLSQSSNILSPKFATIAQNAIIDAAGRLAARSGFLDITTTDITGNLPVKSLFEYRTGVGGSTTILAWDGGIADDVSDPEGNDISGAVVDADGRWWFQNFNESVIGFQNGQIPIVYNGAGTFAPIVPSSGTAPISHRGIGLCAYGRVWGLDADGQTIKYTSLLDETDWGGVGSGNIDMSSVWSEGMDTVTAIVAFNGQLVVFGKRHIIFWIDGRGAALGLNPDDIFVTDTVTGTGCLTQWSIQPVGESDLLYLSPNGVQSLLRVTLSSSNAILSLSKKVRNDIISRLSMLTDVDEIRTTYSPLDGFYLLTLPGIGAANGITYCMDQRFRYQDEEQETLSIITTWTLAPTAWLTKDDFTVQLGDTIGVGTYRGATSDDGNTFRFVFQSPWLDLGEEFADRLKILKRIGSILFVTNSTDVVFKWATDFEESSDSISVTISADATAEWGIGEWGLDEWSGGLSLRIIKVPSRTTAQYFRLGIEADITGEFALQQLELFNKIGRLA